MKKLFTLICILFTFSFLHAQLELNTIGSPSTIDFVGFDGSGISATPTSGQLNSNTWSLIGFSDGDVEFGGEGTMGDFARGITTGLVVTGGVYCVDVFANQRLMVQPVADDFTPGSFRLKLLNNSGSVITQLDISYTLEVQNDENRSNGFNFSYSYDNVSYTDVPELNYVSPEGEDMLGYVNFMNASITGLFIEDGAYFYVSWNGDDVSGTGSRDEFAIDDISITPQSGADLATYNISPTSITVPETSGATSFEITLSESVDCELYLGYTEVTADLPTDFGFVSATVIFTEGGPTTQTIDIGIVDDFEVEPLESFIVYYSVTSGGCVAGADDEIEIFIESNDVSGTAVANITDEILSTESVGVISGEVTLSETADCEVQLSLDAASTMIEGSDYDFSLPINLIFTDGGTLSQTFDISIIDDVEIESTEDLIINLNIISGSCVVGLSGDLDLFIEDNDALDYPEVAIGTIHLEDVDGNCTTIGDLVSLTGIVYGINLWDGGLQFTLIDATGGISVFNFADDLGYTVTEGDEILVKGEIDQFNGLTEIIAAEIELISSGNALVTPLEINAEIGEPMTEEIESNLIRLSLNQMDIVNPEAWLGDGTSFNLVFTNGVETYTMRIDNNTEMANMAFEDFFWVGWEPNDTDAFSVSGIGTQYDSDSPYDSGYQILPRYLSDFDIDYESILELNEIQFSLFPNPTVDFLNFKSDIEIELFEIINQLGEVVKFIALNSNESLIDVQDLIPGFYTMKMKTKGGIYASNFMKI